MTITISLKFIKIIEQMFSEWKMFYNLCRMTCFAIFYEIIAIRTPNFRSKTILYPYFWKLKSDPVKFR